MICTYLKAVQRRAITVIGGLESTAYENKLKDLEKRRLRGDLIALYRIDTYRGGQRTIHFSP